MELDMLEVLLRHRQHIAGVGQEHVAPLLILRHILILALLEVLQLLLVVALYPAGLIQMHGLPAALGVVLVLQSVLDHLKLQLADGADDLAVVELVDEQLGHALVHQLVDALLELLRLHRVVVLDILEQFRRERGQASEVQGLALRQRITYLKDATRIRQTHDVARPGLVDSRLALGHKLRGRGEAHRLALTHMQIGLVTAELSAAHLTEGDTRTVVGVDVGRDLEDEARELLLLGLHLTLLGLRRTGAWGDLYEAVQQFLYAKIVQGRAEEHRSHLGRAVGFHVELRIDTVHQFEILTQFGGILLTYPAVEFLAINGNLYFLRHALLVGGEEVEFLLVDVIHALELGTLVDGPRQRAHLDLQFLFQFVEQVEGVAALTVHLVDEDDDGRLSHTADGHQLTCLRLHALGTVHHDDGGVNGCQRAEGILGEVLVTRRIEDVHLIFYVLPLGGIVELHHRGRHRDTALFLDVHPVGGGGLLDFVVLDGTCHLYLSAEQQEFLCQCRLSRIGVRYDRKCPSSFYLLIHLIIILPQISQIYTEFLIYTENL